MTEGPRDRALIIGCAGQDGSYLAEFLVGRGYAVLGVTRASSFAALANLQQDLDRLTIAQVDLLETARISDLMVQFQPTEIYNFASVSFGPDAWADPAKTAHLSTVALAGLLESIRRNAPSARLFQASSSWIFGRPSSSPQTEATPISPIEPYGAAKAYGNFLIRGFREKYGLFGCSGIFYNHESPRRPLRYVTRKISAAAAQIKLGLRTEIDLGDIDALRDWGYAKDYVEAAWLLLQADEPRDVVIATGELHSVREFAELAFARVALDWQTFVRHDDSLFRGSTDVANLVGDPSLAREVLGWRAKTSFHDLVNLMVDADLNAFSNGAG